MTVSVDDGHKNTSRVAIYVDTLEDLTSITKKYAAGSRGYVLSEDYAEYMLNNNGEWKQMTTGGGGSQLPAAEGNDF